MGLGLGLGLVLVLVLGLGLGLAVQGLLVQQERQQTHLRLEGSGSSVLLQVVLLVQHTGVQLRP